MAQYETLRRGNKSQAVKKLQQSLLDAGYSLGEAGVDGSYGPDTEAAVRAYQKAKGLKIDGIAGSQTQESLFGKTAAPKSTALLAQEALDAYLNREDFHYDINGDALYQQYKDSYVNQGRLAMMDTMGKAAGLTGGYGSTYAQAQGQQAYQSYLQALGEQVPELYRQAYARYLDQGEALYDRYALLAQKEAQEYDRAYQTQRDQVSDRQWEREFQESVRRDNRDFAYTQARDSVLDSRWQKEFEQELQAYQNSQLQWEAEFNEAMRQYDWNYLGKYATGGDSLSDLQGGGSYLDGNGVRVEYDNGQVSTGNIMAMQRALGIAVTGRWTDAEVVASRGRTADEAYAAYRKGLLQNITEVGVKEEFDPVLQELRIRKVQQQLGLEPTGQWGALEQAASGGMSAHHAWLTYEKGELKQTGITEHKIRAMEAALGLPQDGKWNKDDALATGGMTPVRAWEFYKRGLLYNRQNPLAGKEG